MAYLDIVVDKYLEGPSAEGHGAVADILPLGDQAAAAPELSNVIIPVGHAATPRRFTLPEGDYVVQARMPSGEFLSKRVRLTDKEPEHVVLRGASSPNEWLSWQTYLGDAPSRASVEAASQDFTAEDFGLEMATDARDAFPGAPETSAGAGLHPEMASVIVKEGLPGQVSSFYDRLGHWLSPAQGTLVGNAHDAVAVMVEGHGEAHLGPDLASLGPWEHSPGFSQLTLGPDMGPYLPEIYPDQPHERLYVFGAQHGTTWLSTLPMPWRNVRTNETCRAAITFRDHTGGRRSMNIVMLDTAVAPMLGYLRSGDTAAANTLLDEAQNYLFGKVTNPFSAAAGGIVLVSDRRWRGSGETHGPNWRNWIRNLAEWFPWLPDGRILHGWMYLLSGEEEDMGEARKQFLRAAHLGLPAYTESMRLLVHGLKLFNHEARSHDAEDDEVNAALGRIEPVANRLDTQQTFATIRLATSRKS